MKMNEKYYPIDLNVAEVVKNKIAKLAKAYTLEWIFNEKDPDIGSTIAILLQICLMIMRIKRICCFINII